MARPRRQYPALDLTTRARLSDLCEVIGLAPVATKANVSNQTLALALAGAAVLPATARVLALAIDELERAREATACVSPNVPNQAAV